MTVAPRLCLPVALLAACLLGPIANAQTPTWSENIAPILYANCTTCHRPGQVAPFSLLTYTDAFQHGRTMAAQTQSRTMPPWKPETGWTSFRDQRGLSSDQISLIQQWVAAGMPQGDTAKAPAPPTYVDGWQLGTPDLILQMPKGYSVPADGPDIYRNFVFPTGTTTDHWVRAIELKPSARALVHHVLLFTDTTGTARGMDSQDGSPGFPGFNSIPNILLKDPLNALSGGLGGWVPGTTPAFLPSGIAYSLPAGSDVMIQTHFHPNGKADVEQTTIGIYYTSKPPRSITQLQAPAIFGRQANIDIPAGQSDYTVRSSFTFPVDVDAFSVSAHVHYLGRGTRLTATLPTGEVKILLWIKDWNFNWQDTYIYKDLIALPKGTRIDGELVYDNSSGNPYNPNSPPKRVQWGEQSTDEMGSLILNVVPHVASDLTTLQLAVAVYSGTTAPAVGTKPLLISAGVVDGASALSGAVSPGKVVVLYGQRMGPANLAVSQPSGGKYPSSLGGTQVFFDNVPAPLLYSSTGQVSAIVPYAVDGKPGTQMKVQVGSLVSDPIALPVTPVGPSIFSANTSGTGQGAILNSDLSVNTSANPAPKNSIIVIYATGEGQTSPGGVDGQQALTTFPKPLQPVTVNIGGLPAQVLYAGAAPSLVAGVIQINAQLPPGVPSGDVPVQVVVGTTSSQQGITVAVK